MSVVAHIVSAAPCSLSCLSTVNRFILSIFLHAPQAVWLCSAAGWTLEAGWLQPAGRVPLYEAAAGCGYVRSCCTAIISLLLRL